ncbi:MAG: DUF3693 domain-containing protein [Rudaea sp.]
MNATNRYLDQCKTALGVQSDYALAKALDVATQRLSNYRSERVSADHEMCLKIAEALRLDPMTVMGDVMKETARTPKARAMWSKYSTAALLFLTVGVISAKYTSILVEKCLYIM